MTIVLNKKKADSMVLLSVVGESAGRVRLVGYAEDTGEIKVWAASECRIQTPGVGLMAKQPVVLSPPQNDTTEADEKEFNALADRNKPRR